MENYIKDIVVDESVFTTRYNICKTCEHYREKVDQCRVCGCVMRFKTKFAKSSCPKTKWESVLVSIQNHKE